MKITEEQFENHLRWETVEPIFRYYLSVWPNNLPLNWAKVSWQALVESGKTVYSSEEEELTVRSYTVALSLVYYEYCHRTAFHELPRFIYWSDETLRNLKNDLSADAEAIEQIISDVTRPLFEKIGDRETALELWINCVESSRGFPMTAKEKAGTFRHFIEDFSDDFNYDRGHQFVLGGLDNLAGYYSVSGLGVFTDP